MVSAILEQITITTIHYISTHQRSQALYDTRAIVLKPDCFQELYQVSEVWRCALIEFLRTSLHDVYFICQFVNSSYPKRYPLYV